uniref:Uncharacterized protein n=1 Tax=Glossina morsitans morsitans TaxID=37546 RepID=A0A1B0FM57_GLOMM
MTIITTAIAATVTTATNDNGCGTLLMRCRWHIYDDADDDDDDDDGDDDDDDNDDNDHFDDYNNDAIYC